MKNIGHVIHAVGPYYYSYDAPTNYELMQSVTLNVLETAKRQGFVQVSIPSISSGIFGFPKPKCAEIMMLYTMAWLRRGDCGEVRRVRMCNFDSETTKIFQKFVEGGF